MPGGPCSFEGTTFTVPMTLPDPPDMRSATVADVAVIFPQAINVLNRYKLDYCCNGGKQFVGACSNLGLEAGSVWHEILQAAQQPPASRHIRVDSWTTPFLIDYIVQQHHGFVRDSTLHILELLKKVQAAHSEGHPEVTQVRLAFEQLSEELVEHMTKEEVVVFPAIRRIAEQASSGAETSISTTLLVALQDEHEAAGRLIAQIRSLTDNYKPPIYARPTFQMTWKLLKEFDEDLMQHIHLENNILFPRVKAEQ